MVRIDISDDRDHRLQMHKGGIALIRLRDQISSTTQTRIGTGAIEFAADNEGWIKTTFGQHAGNQTGCGGLAMGTGYSNAITKTHQLCQHVRQSLPGCPV